MSRHLNHLISHKIIRQQDAPQFLLHKLRLFTSQRQPAQLHRLLDLPVTQFDFPAMTVQICHFSTRITHGIRHRRQQMADFSFAHHGQQPGCHLISQSRPLFPCLRAGFQLHQMVPLTQLPDLFILCAFPEWDHPVAVLSRLAPCIQQPQRVIAFIHQGQSVISGLLY
ncbi:hypothetical protein D3C75_747520 [compost metagenome]